MYMCIYTYKCVCMGIYVYNVYDIFLSWQYSSL